MRIINTILGIKRAQSQIFTTEGMRIPITSIEVGPCFVTACNSFETHTSVQLGFKEIKKINKPKAGHIKKAGLDKKLRFFREVRVTQLTDNLKPGSKITVDDVIQPDDIVRITGTSKGKGFAGVVKRHHFKGGPRTHGQSDKERSPGSIGMTTTPGRVFRGKRMAGRMGNETIGISGLRVVSVDKERNLLVVKGLVPGALSGFLTIEVIKPKPQKEPALNTL